MLVRDDLNDTAIFIQKLELNIKNLDLNSKSIHLNQIKIHEPYTNIYYKGNDSLNISNLISSIKKEEQNPFEWQIKCNQLQISNSKNKYKYPNGDSVCIHNFFAKLTNIQVDSTITNLKTDNLSFNINQQKFLSNLQFILHRHDKHFIIDSLYLNTERSNLTVKTAQITLNKKQLEGKINIGSSIINLQDFSYFKKSLVNYREEINISGEFEFDDKTISGDKLKVFIGQESSILANFRLLNYKNKNKLAYYVNFENGFTNRSDIVFIAKNYFKLDSINLPREVDVLGSISYQGLLQGSMDSIQSQGTLYSDIGIIESNLILRKESEGNKIAINGSLQTLPVHLNKITHNESFGELSLNINTDGYYSKNKGLNLNLDGYINHIDFNLYNLDSIAISGLLTDNYFNGKISSYDPNLRADFEGEILIGNQQSYNFNTNIYSANLYALGINKTDSSANLSVNINANMKGENLENSEGSIIIKDLFLIQDTTYIATDSIIIKSEYYNNEKHLSLRSEFIDIDFNGIYYIPTLIRDIEIFANKFAPSLIQTVDTTNQNLNNFKFNILAKYPHPITEILLSEVRIAPGTNIKGEFSSINQELKLTCHADHIKYLNRSVTDLEIHSYTKQDKLNINIESKELKYSDKNSLKNFLLSLSIKNDTVINNLNWNNWLDKNYSGNINSQAIILPGFTSENPNFKVNFDPSNIIIIDTVWTLNSCSVVKDSTGIFFDNVEMKKGNSELKLNGKLSKNPEDSIMLALKNINLYNLNVLLKKDKLRFGGFLNGETKIKDLYGERIINSDFKIADFILNDEKVGNLYTRSMWNKEKEQLDIEGHALNNNIKTFKFEGYIATIRKEMSINIGFINQKMELLEAFLKPTFDNITGRVSGDIHVFGNPKNPEWKGQIQAKNAQFTLNPTNVVYQFSDSVKLIDNKILFDDIHIYDPDSNFAVVNGNIYHSRLKDFGVDFAINTNKMLALDTKAQHHPYYYGKVFGSGVVNINGSTKDIRIDISATTLNNSIFFVPLEGRSEIKENDFITFIDRSKIQTELGNKKNTKTKKTDIKAKTNINIDLTITPSTEIQIMFDPKIGDVLKARGNAQINIESKPNNFGIYGDFIIDKGDFLFTLQDVINKKLEIVQGSSVSWTGHPIDADINLDAIYRVRKASIYDLTQDSTDRDKRVPVDCHMLMTNKLTNPDIKFEIEVTSNSDNIAIEQINSLPEDEVNKQILSLMILNKFAPLTTANSGQETSTTASLGATTVSELLSNQLSYWMSQLNSDIDFGFTYRPGIGDIQNEYELALSTTLWDERVTVYGNLGYGGQNTQATNPNSPYTTEFMLELKVNKKGNVRLRAFNKENDDIDDLNPAAYKQGVGIFYTEDFDDFSQLMQHMFRKNAATKPDEIELENTD